MACAASRTEGATPGTAAGMSDPCPNGATGVALSGGRDSALAASILTRRGTRVVSYTLWLTTDQDVQAAASIAEALDIPHCLIDVRDAFEREVVEQTVRQYRGGLTPNPCVRCNLAVKFPTVLERAFRDGCTSVITGHYARVRPGKRASLLRARDLTRDQSYFLCRLAQQTLRNVHFPLGELTTKSRARRQQGFALGERCLSPSRDACFLGNRGLRAFLADRLGPTRAGPVVDRAGEVLGAHRGAVMYTVGQRKGLGLAGGPWYVLATDVPSNTVTVGTAESAQSRRLAVTSLNWVSTPAQTTEFRADVQIRSSHRAARATVHPQSRARAIVEFDCPQFGIAPGQLAVLYDGDLLLAGGYIAPSG